MANLKQITRAFTELTGGTRKFKNTEEALEVFGETANAMGLGWSQDDKGNIVLAEIEETREAPPAPPVQETPAEEKAPAEASSIANLTLGGAKNRATPIPITETILVLAKENPKKAGSAAHRKFALYTDEMTVGEFLKAGGTRIDIKWDLDHGFIALGSQPLELPEEPAEA